MEESLVFRNLFFTMIQPGVVGGLIPYWILGSRVSETLKNRFIPIQYLAIFIFAIGITILFYCIYLFAVKGKGTLSPADPTTKLVVSGLYKFSRNPMYIGVMLILVGEAGFFSSAGLWLYSVLVFIAFNLFIILHVEPRLKRDFGTDYQRYRKSVRRWL